MPAFGRGAQRKSHPSICVCFCLLPANPPPSLLNPPPRHTPPVLTFQAATFFFSFRAEKEISVLHREEESAEASSEAQPCGITGLVASLHGGRAPGGLRPHSRAPHTQALLPAPLGSRQRKHQVTVWHVLHLPPGINTVSLALRARVHLSCLQKQKIVGFPSEPGTVTGAGQTPFREDR